MKTSEVLDILQIVEAATGMLMQAYPAMAALVARLESDDDATIEELRELVADVNARSDRIAAAIAAGRHDPTEEGGGALG